MALEAISPESAALRSQDFHEALRDHVAYAPAEVDFRNTLLIGKAAELAMHLRGLLVVRDERALRYAATQLGIRGGEFEPVIRELEEVDFVSVVRDSSDRIKRLEVRVPEFRDGYKDLGERWKELHPTELEHAGIQTLSNLLRKPIPIHAIGRDLGLDQQNFRLVREVLEAGRLAVREILDGTPIYYSPLAVDADPRAYLEWSQKHPEDAQRLAQEFREHQGLPLDPQRLAKDAALRDAVDVGVLMPVAISGATGPRNFLFSPRGGLDQTRRTILEKARAVVACVRYGENFAASTRIKYPKAIVDRLIEQKKFKRGHPDLPSQYGLLVEKMIGSVEEDEHGGYNFVVHDTDENMLALRIAREMLDTGDVTAAMTDLGAQRWLSSPTGYAGPITCRPKFAEHFEQEAESRSDIIKRISSLGRGGSL